MNSFPVQTIKNQQFFSQQLVIDKNFILLDPAIPFTDTLRKALVEWDFKVVYSEGSLRGSAPTLESKSENVSVSEFDDSSEEFDVDAFNNNQSSPKPKTGEPEHKEGINSAVKKVLDEAHNDITQNSEKSRMDVVQTVYNEYLNYINAVYTRYATHKDLNLREISDTIKDLCMFIRDNRRYVLRIQPNPDAKARDFLINHSMRTTTLAITIGLQLHIPLSNLIELGVTSLLHEIGQIRLPPQLYITDKKLSAPEKAQLSTHPILGAKIMKENNFPIAIQLGVLQHHERENGQGYPQKISGVQIHQYAKIISVACSFEAITSPRHFREAKTTYDAMVEMLRNEQSAYDDTVIKALLYSLSLFPIGAYVFLSNGRIAQVTDVNPIDPKNPIIQIVGMKDASGNPLTVQSDNEKYKIARVLNKQEAADILKTLK